MARILDLAGDSAVFGTRLMAEAGHDVVRVDDTSRALPPSTMEDVAYDAFMHAGKRRVALDLANEVGRRTLLDLATACDAVVLGEATQISPDELLQANASVVVTHVIDENVELLAAARSGLLALTGHPGRSPRLPGGHVIFAASGLYVAVATALALYQRGKIGRGQVVSVSVRQALESLIEQAMTDYTFAGKSTERRGSRGAITAVSGALECKDGYWMLSLLHSGEGWTRMMNWMRDPELAADPDLADEAKRHEKPDYILDRIEAWSRGIDQKQIIREAQEHRIPASPVCTPLDLVADEQLLARGFLQRVEHPDFGPMVFPRGAVATILGTETKLYPAPYSDEAKHAIGAGH